MLRQMEERKRLDLGKGGISWNGFCKYTEGSNPCQMGRGAAPWTKAPIWWPLEPGAPFSPPHKEHSYQPARQITATVT